MKKTIFIFCLMFWTFAAASYSQRAARIGAIAAYKAVKAASNFKPPVRVPIVPPSVPSVPTLVMEYDTIVKKDIRAHYDSAACRTVYDTVEHIVVLPVGFRFEKIDSLAKYAKAEVGNDTSSVPPAISSVKPPKERKTVSLLENDMPPWGWLLVAVIVILGVYTYGCCRSTEKEKEAQRRQEAARKPEEKREDKKSSAAPETQPRRQPSPKAPSAAKSEKPSGILYVDSKGVVRKKIEE